MYLKKIFAYILLSVMIFTTACTQGPQMFDFLAPESDPNDFEGSDILIYWNYSAVYSVDKEAKGTPLDDALAERISNISKKYNCNIKLLERQDSEALLINWMNGSYVCDIYAGGIREYAETDLLYPIETFGSIIDFSDEAKFGTKETREAGMYNGISYGVTPQYWPGLESAYGYLLSYNRDLFNSFELTDLHEYYENNVWTYETFEKEYLPTVDFKDKDGNVIYAMTTHYNNIPSWLILSNDVKYIKVDDNGYLTPDPTSKSFLNAITWCKEIFTEYSDVLSGVENTHDQVLYRTQKALTTTIQSSQVTSGNIVFNELAKFETGIVPIPCGPDAEYGKWKMCSRDLYAFAIPTTSINAENSATVINALCEPFEEFGGANGLVDFYSRNYFFTQTDAEIFVDLCRSCKFSYMDYEDKALISVYDDIGKSIINPQASITEALDKNKNYMLKIIEDYMIPNYNAVYGE